MKEKRANVVVEAELGVGVGTLVVPGATVVCGVAVVGATVVVGIGVGVAAGPSYMY
jgi:hypothetical protein